MNELLEDEINTMINGPEGNNEIVDEGNGRPEGNNEIVDEGNRRPEGNNEENILEKFRKAKLPDNDTTFSDAELSDILEENYNSFELAFEELKNKIIVKDFKKKKLSELEPNDFTDDELLKVLESRIDYKEVFEEIQKKKITNFKEIKNLDPFSYLDDESKKKTDEPKKKTDKPKKETLEKVYSYSFEEIKPKIIKIFKKKKYLYGGTLPDDVLSNAIKKCKNNLSEVFDLLKDKVIIEYFREKIGLTTDIFSDNELLDTLNKSGIYKDVLEKVKNKKIIEQKKLGHAIDSDDELSNDFKKIYDDTFEKLEAKIILKDFRNKKYLAPNIFSDEELIKTFENTNYKNNLAKVYKKKMEDFKKEENLDPSINLVSFENIYNDAFEKLKPELIQKFREEMGLSKDKTFSNDKLSEALQKNKNNFKDAFELIKKEKNSQNASEQNRENVENVQSEQIKNFRDEIFLSNDETFSDDELSDVLKRSYNNPEVAFPKLKVKIIVKDFRKKKFLDPKIYTDDELSEALENCEKYNEVLKAVAKSKIKNFKKKENLDPFTFLEDIKSLKDLKNTYNDAFKKLKYKLIKKFREKIGLLNDETFSDNELSEALQKSKNNFKDALEKLKEKIIIKDFIKKNNLNKGATFSDEDLLEALGENPDYEHILKEVKEKEIKDFNKEGKFSPLSYLNNEDKSKLENVYNDTIKKLEPMIIKQFREKNYLDEGNFPDNNELSKVLKNNKYEFDEAFKELKANIIINDFRKRKFLAPNTFSDEELLKAFEKKNYEDILQKIEKKEIKDFIEIEEFEKKGFIKSEENKIKDFIKSEENKIKDFIKKNNLNKDDDSISDEELLKFLLENTKNEKYKDFFKKIKNSNKNLDPFSYLDDISKSTLEYVYNNAFEKLKPELIKKFRNEKVLEKDDSFSDEELTKVLEYYKNDFEKVYELLKNKVDKVIIEDFRKKKGLTKDIFSDDELLDVLSKSGNYDAVLKEVKKRITQQKKLGLDIASDAQLPDKLEKIYDDSFEKIKAKIIIKDFRNKKYLDRDTFSDEELFEAFKDNGDIKKVKEEIIAKEFKDFQDKKYLDPYTYIKEKFPDINLEEIYEETFEKRIKKN